LLRLQRQQQTLAHVSNASPFGIRPQPFINFLLFFNKNGAIKQGVLLIKDIAEHGHNSGWQALQGERLKAFKRSSSLNPIVPVQKTYAKQTAS
jgi:hypothetical protein